MVTEKTLMKFGFIEDKNNLRLKEVLKDNLKLKEIHIDTYSENPLIATFSEPFMLLLRTSEKDAVVSSDGDRIILKRNDKHNTYLSNVLFSKITECYYKASNDFSELILRIQNIYYKITIFN